MPFQVQCPNQACGKFATLPDHAVGKKIICNSCQGQFQAPASIPANPAPANELNLQNDSPPANPATRARPSAAGRPRARARRKKVPAKRGARNTRPKNNSGNKQGIAIALPSTSLLILILMALPWLSLSCSGTKLLEQNGYQTIIGDASFNMSNDITKNAKKSSGDDDMAAWWLGFMVLGTLVAGFAGFMMYQGSESQNTLALIGAGCAALTLTGTLAFGFPLEQQADEMRRDISAKKKTSKKTGNGSNGNEFEDQMNKAMGKISVKANKEIGLWLTLLVVWGQVGLAFYLWNE